MNSTYYRCSPATILQDRYEIMDIINISPASKLYKGYDKHSDNYVLIKEMLYDMAKQSVKEQILEQFNCEVKILFKLSHVSLPNIKDYFDYNNNKYLIFDYRECKKLNVITENRPEFLPEEDVIDWAIQLCDVLSYLHNNKPVPVIFRNLSPYNIFLTEDNKIKLLDFGISKLVNIETMNIAKVITPNYSPLEQHAGKTDNRSDIYSLGATMYYLLTKVPPMDVLDRIIEDVPMPDCDRFNSHISPELVNIISKAMELEKKDRYQRIEDLKSELLILSSKKNKYGHGVSLYEPSRYLEKDFNDFEGLSLNEETIKMPEKTFITGDLKECIVKQQLNVFNKISPLFIDEPFSKNIITIKEPLTSSLHEKQSVFVNSREDKQSVKSIGNNGVEIIVFNGIMEDTEEDKEIKNPSIFETLYTWLRDKIAKTLYSFA